MTFPGGELPENCVLGMVTKCDLPSGVLRMTNWWPFGTTNVIFFLPPSKAEDTALAGVSPGTNACPTAAMLGAEVVGATGAGLEAGAGDGAEAVAGLGGTTGAGEATGADSWRNTKQN